MGKFGATINLAKRVSAWSKAGGVSAPFRAQSLPKNIDIAGLRLAPRSVGDVCTFKADKTLCPKFLESLMKIDDADPVKFTTEVRSRMLRAMGYSHPELMKVKSDAMLPNGFMAFDFFSGELLYANTLNGLNKAEKVALIRHELDHFDKATKIFKSVGADAYSSALRKRFFLNRNAVNNEFFVKMSKDADVTNFDLPRYLDYFLNPKLIRVNDPKSFDCLRNSNIYVTESLEDSAYLMQKRVLQALKQEEPLPSDVYGKPLKKVLNQLENMNVSDERRMEIYLELCDAVSAQNLSSFAQEKYIIEQVGSWLEKGYTSIDDILAAGAV